MKPGIFGSWSELWAVAINLCGLMGLLLLILVGGPAFYAWVSR